MGTTEPLDHPLAILFVQRAPDSPGAACGAHTRSRGPSGFDRWRRKRETSLPVREVLPNEVERAYTQLDVTLGRLGEASGTSDQPDHLEIINVLRDDAFKVLFTKNGTLYVVTTLPEYEAWLTDILTTWQFTD